MPNVTITPPSVIQVKVGTPRPPTVTSVSSGTNRLHNASDLNLNGLANNSVISYNASTDNFVVVDIGTLPFNIQGLDGGTF